MTNETPKDTFDLRKYKRTPNFTTIYTNNVNFAFTPVDIQMICSTTTASMDENIEAVEEVATIIMTPQQAKAVLGAFLFHVQRYEEAHGEIIMPKDKQPALSTKKQQVLASAARPKKR